MAGLLSGAIAGAIGGGGKAMQFNAQSSIEQKREAALEKLRHGNAMERQDDQQQFTAGENEQDRGFRKEERIAGQEFTAGQNQLTREQERQLAVMRESGANSRAAMGRNDWKMMTSSDGKPVRVNTRTGVIEAMAVPEGIDLSSDSWGDRDQAYIESLQAEMDGLQEIAKTGILSDEQQSRLQQIPQEMRTYAQGIDADAEVLGAYEGMQGGNGNVPPEGIRRPGLLSGEGGSDSGAQGASGSGEPTDAREVIFQREQQAQAKRATREKTEETKRLSSVAKDTANDLKNFRDYANTSMGGGSSEWASRERSLLDQGRQQMTELMSAYNGTQDEDLRSLLMESMEELREAGVPLPQQ